MTTMQEIKRAYEFAADAKDSYQKEGRDIPVWFYEKVLKVWKDTIDLCTVRSPPSRS